MASLKDVAKKVAIETAATASAPVLAASDMAKNLAVSYLQLLKPRAMMRIPGMEMIAVLNEMRKKVVEKLDHDNDNEISPEREKREEKISVDVEESVDLLKDIRDRLDDLLELFGRKEKREIRKDKIEKHKNIQYDTQADIGGDNIDDMKPHKNFKGWLNKITNLNKLWKIALKSLLPAGIGLYLGIKALDNGFTQIGMILKNIFKPLKHLGTMVKGFGRYVRKAGGLFEVVLKPFSGILKAIKGIPGISMLKNVLGLSRAVRGLGKYLFGPITMTLFGIYEFVSGFLESYQKDGSILKAIGSGIDELLKSFTVKPLDLIKDIISWSLEKLGFENASKWLDSWSFEDFYEKLKTMAKDSIEMVYKALKSHFKRIGGYFTKFYEEYMPSYEDITKEISEEWEKFTGFIGDISTYIQEVISNPSKLWEDIKKNLPDFEKIREDLLKKIPSFEEIKKKLDGFTFEKVFGKLKTSLEKFSKWLKDLVNFDMFSWFKDNKEEKKPVVPERFTAKPDSQMKQQEIEALKAYTKKLDSSNTQPNIIMNMNDNKSVVTGNQNQPDVTPNVLTTTPYAPRWETD